MPYKDLQKRKAYMSSYERKNKKRLNAYKLSWYHQTNRKEYMKMKYQENLIENRRKRRENNQRRRLEIIEYLGGKCSCGFGDVRALQVDHVNGGGTKDRKNFGHSASGLYHDIKAHPEKYQLLCANCNWIKRHESKEMYANM